MEPSKDIWILLERFVDGDDRPVTLHDVDVKSGDVLFSTLQNQFWVAFKEKSYRQEWLLVPKESILHRTLKDLKDLDEMPVNKIYINAGQTLKPTEDRLKPWKVINQCKIGNSIFYNGSSVETKPERVKVSPELYDKLRDYGLF